MKAIETIETDRLLLRKPHAGDTEAIFRRYASDPEVTRYMSWPTHRSVADTEAFLAWSDADWEKWPAGSYLVFARGENQLLGGTGLSFAAPDRVLTGYILARDAWGFGYATESLRAMVQLAQCLGLHQLEASCHSDHRASAHVLEKGGFVLRAIERELVHFPNLGPKARAESLRYMREL